MPGVYEVHEFVPECSQLRRFSSGFHLQVHFSLCLSVSLSLCLSLSLFLFLSLPLPSVSPSCIKWSYSQVREVHKRRYLLRHCALEVFSNDGQSMFLIFHPPQREKIYQRYVPQLNVLLNHGLGNLSREDMCVIYMYFISATFMVLHVHFCVRFEKHFQFEKHFLVCGIAIHCKPLPFSLSCTHFPFAPPLLYFSDSSLWPSPLTSNNFWLILT